MKRSSWAAASGTWTGVLCTLAAYGLTDSILLGMALTIIFALLELLLFFKAFPIE